MSDRGCAPAVTALALLVGLLWCGHTSLAQPGETLIANGNFDRDLADWSQWFAPGQSEGAARWVKRDDGGAMEVTIARRDTSSAVQIFQGPFKVREGAWYAVSFEARAARPMGLRVAFIRHSAPYGSLGLSTEVAIGTEWEQFSLLAQATATSDNARIDFFPEASCWLDSVSVRELGQSPPAWPVRSVRLGRGWQGDAGKLVDGDSKSLINSRYYPVLPLLLTLDLGEVRPVGAVIVEGQDRGRHVRTGRLDLEVSADGTDWLRWATPAKSSEGSAAGTRRTRFAAPNVGVPVRYIRLRVRAVRGSARLSEVRVLAATAAAPAALARLPRVAPEEDLAFLGWDYDRLGYDLTPGEAAALRFTNQGERQVQVPLAWRLEQYIGSEVARGEGVLRVGALADAEVPLGLPAELTDGPYRLRFRLGAAEAEQAFYFDYRVAQRDSVLSLRLAALLDNLDPEGWVRLICGPVAPFVDVRRSLPERAEQIDAALVMAENWPAGSPLVQRLTGYLQAGGRALFYGKVCASLGEVLPVEIDESAPWLETPQRLEPPSFWPDFEPTEGPRQYAVRVRAKPGAKVLAKWEDGTPAVVGGRFGRGRVVYVGAGPGRAWQRHPGLEGADELTLRALYYLLDRQGAPQALQRLAEEALASRQKRRADVITRAAGDAPKTAQEGESRGNVGRFGWLVREGGLTENLSADGEMRSPAATAPWRVTVPGRGPFTGRPTGQNWLSKRIAWRDEQGVALTSTISMLTSSLLWEGAARRVDITGDATHVAFAMSGGVRVLGRGEQAAGAEMEAHWIVLFRGEPELRDAPRLVVLSRRPEQLRLAESLELTFDEGGFGALWTGRLFGLRRLTPGETATWVSAFPPAARDQAAALGRQCLAFPTAGDEVFWRDGDAVMVANRFEYRTFKDDWGTSPQQVAPLPPVLSLVRQHGFPVNVAGRVKATGVATKYGPLEVVAGDRVRYRLPLPPRDHFGVIPVEGQMALAEAIDHYGLQGIESVKRASGGLTTGDPFLADLRAYMASGSVPPFEASCLDLYKWWYCFPTVLGRPAYGEQARAAIDPHYREHYWRTLNFYPHKCFIRQRREPWTGLDYIVTFIWPVTFRDGVRYFVDENEAAAVILYCLEAYSRYYGDWTTPASNWNLCRNLHGYLRRVHDWALMASSNQEFYSTVGIDMLNSEYPGNLAFARLAHQVGDAQAEALGLYLAAKAAVPAVARLYMPDYVQSITAPGDPWREARYYWSFRETGLGGAQTMVQRGNTDFIVALAGGLLDTSKGTSPEICLLYKHFARDRMDAYEHAVQATEREYKVAAGWAHLMDRAFLRWPRQELLATARQFHTERPNWGWQSTKGPHNLAVVCVADTPLFLADWAPAEYVNGRFTPGDRTVRLAFDSRESGSYSVRLYSQWPPRDARLNGKPFADWSYVAQTGWLTLKLRGPGEAKVEIRLQEQARAPAHPYFAP